MFERGAVVRVIHAHEGMAEGTIGVVDSYNNTIIPGLDYRVILGGGVNYFLRGEYLEEINYVESSHNVAAAIVVNDDIITLGSRVAKADLTPFSTGNYVERVLQLRTSQSPSTTKVYISNGRWALAEELIRI